MSAAGNAPRSLRKGVACILLSAFGFALMAMFVRLSDACGEPLPAVQKALFRNLVAAAIAGWAFFSRPVAVRRNVRIPDGMKTWTDLLLRCAFGTVGIFANFYALTHIPVGNAMALNRTAPFFTLLMSWLLLGQRMTVRQTVCVAGAFAGAMFVIKPGCAGMFSGPALVGLSSGFGAGAAYAFLHKLGKAGVRADRAVRNDLRVMPADAAIPLHDEHVIRKDDAEAELLSLDGLFFGMLCFDDG